MGGAVGVSEICLLAVVLCILGPVCLTGVSAGRILGLDGSVAIGSLISGECFSGIPGARVSSSLA